MSAPAEIRLLLRQLRSLAGDTNAVAGERALEIRRLLHSIKSWADQRGYRDLAVLCHDWEERCAGPDLPDAPVLEALRQACADMAVLMEGSPEPSPELEESAWFGLSAPLPLLDERELRVVAAARDEGAEARWCRVWISPEEPWPVIRVMVLLTRLEVLGLVRAEAWLAEAGTARGPFDPQRWAAGHDRPEGWNGRGAWLRCLYLRRGRTAAEVLQIDQVEALLDTPCPVQEWGLPPVAARDLSLVDLDRDEVLHQALLLEAGGVPLPRQAFLSALGRQPAGPALGGRLRELASRAITGLPAGSALRWQWYDEAPGLSRQTLAMLGELVGQLARNVLAHAVEPATARLARYRNGPLRVALSLWEEAGEVCLRFEDDGPGIDRAAVAARLGHDSLDDAGLLAAIEAAGLSTRDQADRLGGRGMGLNIVGLLARRVLGGSLALETGPGSGTAFTVRFPADLADLSVLPVIQGETRMALPQVLVGACLDLAAPSARIHRDRTGAEYLAAGGASLPIRRSPGGGGRWGLVVRPDGGPGLVLAADDIGVAETVLLRPGQSEVYLRQAAASAPLFPGVRLSLP